MRSTSGDITPTRWSSSSTLMKLATSMPGLIETETQFVEHPSFKPSFQPSRTSKTNRPCGFLALALWLFFFVYCMRLVYDVTCRDFQDLERSSLCPAYQREKLIKAWDVSAGRAPLRHVYIKSFDNLGDDIVLETKLCKIFHGNYTGYVKHRDIRKSNNGNGYIHPTEGGCRRVNITDLSAAELFELTPEEGGCRHYKLEPRKSCIRLPDMEIVGKFGDPEYAFVAVTMSRWFRSPKDLTEKRKASFELVFQDFAEGGRSYTWMGFYMTMDCWSKVLKEVFFQLWTEDTWNSFGKVTKRRFTNYNREYSRFGAGTVEMNNASLMMINASKLIAEPQEFATFFLRGTTTRIEIQEKPAQGWIDIPMEAGGFFEGGVVFLAVILRIFWLTCTRRGSEMTPFSELWASEHSKHGGIEAEVGDALEEGLKRGVRTIGRRMTPPMSLEEGFEEEAGDELKPLTPSYEHVISRSGMTRQPLDDTALDDRFAEMERRMILRVEAECSKRRIAAEATGEESKDDMCETVLWCVPKAESSEYAVARSMARPLPTPDGLMLDGISPPGAELRDDACGTGTAESSEYAVARSMARSSTTPDALRFDGIGPPGSGASTAYSTQPDRIGRQVASDSLLTHPPLPVLTPSGISFSVGSSYTGPLDTE